MEPLHPGAIRPSPSAGAGSTDKPTARTTGTPQHSEPVVGRRRENVHCWNSRVMSALRAEPPSQQARAQRDPNQRPVFSPLPCHPPNRSAALPKSCQSQRARREEEVTEAARSNNCIKHASRITHRVRQPPSRAFGHTHRAPPQMARRLSGKPVRPNLHRDGRLVKYIHERTSRRRRVAATYM